MSRIVFDVTEPDGVNRGEPGHEVRRINGSQTDTWYLSDGDLLVLWLAVTDRLVSAVVAPEGSVRSQLALLVNAADNRHRGQQWVERLRAPRPAPVTIDGAGLTAHVDKIPEH